MGSSGLLYAAIVAAWAAVLVPRWIRRNEEIERAREEDTSRGVRVLDRQHRQVRAHSGLSTDRASSEHQPTETAAPAPVGGRALTEDPPVPGGAPARRRRTLVLLLVAVGACIGGAVGGMVPAGLVVLPVLLLLAFLVLARRAAVLEARRYQAALGREAARRRGLAAAQRQAAPSKRVAVLDEPARAEPTDPNAWEPVPVPLPTYLTKPKAEPSVVRKIDLSSPGAWTSGRLNPERSMVPAPQPAIDSDLPERRRAVGD